MYLQKIMTLMYLHNIMTLMYLHKMSKNTVVQCAVAAVLAWYGGEDRQSKQLCVPGAVDSTLLPITTVKQLCVPGATHSMLLPVTTIKQPCVAAAVESMLLPVTTNSNGNRQNQRMTC